MLRKLASLIALALVVAGLLLTSYTAQAHTPTFSHDCSGFTLNLASYNGTNHVTISINGVTLVDTNFGASYHLNHTYADQTIAHHVHIVVKAHDDAGHPEYSPTYDFTDPACVTPTHTPTNTPTDTPTNTPTATPTNTDTPENTPTPTSTDTDTNTPEFTPTPTNTDAFTPTPTDTPFEESTPTPTPFQPTPTPFEMGYCFIEGSEVWAVASGDLYVYGNGGMVSREFGDHGRYIVSSLDSTQFHDGDVIPLTWGDGTVYALLTLDGHLCRTDPHDGQPTPTPTNTPCCVLPHQDEPLRQDATGAWSMIADLWDIADNSYHRLIVSSAPFDVTCGANSIGVHSAAPSGYYIYYGSQNCTPSRAMYNYGVCSLTPDANHRYWLSSDHTSILLFPGQALGEIQAALTAAGLDAHSADALYNGANWYTLR